MIYNNIRAESFILFPPIRSIPLVNFSALVRREDRARGMLFIMA
tara:strand:- start:745 stop:876 length:132 start_codon:yes stop_codon:yes gene_type:complete